MNRFLTIVVIIASVLVLVKPANGQNIITYDFQTNSFDKVIPFDVLITYKFTNIPLRKDITSLEMEIVEMNKIGEAGKPFCDVQKLSPDSFTEDSTATLVIEKYFPPNKDFIFKISLNGMRKLTNAEKDILETNIIKSKIVSKHLAKLSQALVEIDFAEAADAVNITFNDILYSVDSLAEIQLGNDVEYSFDKVNNPISTFGNLSKIFMNINSAIEDTKENSNYKADTTGNYKSWIIDFEANLDSLTFFPFRNFDDAQVVIDSMSSSGNVFGDVVEYWGDLVTFKDQNAENSPNNFINLTIEGIISNNMIKVAGLTSQSYEKGLVEQSKNYFAIDLGGAYVPALDKFIFFTSASFYFRPVKRAIPLRMYKGWDILWTRLSVDIGMSLSSIAVENQTKGMFGTNNGLIIGAGFRVLSFAKINVGAIVYEVNNTNSLIDSYSNKASFYIGLSLDLSVSALFKENFSSISANK